MKVWQKISVFLAMLVLCFGMINMPVSAATNTQDGLKVTLTTDKDMYSQSDEIKVNISVENTNSFDVNNVSLESIIPDGLELKKDYSSSATIGNLAAGDSYKYELVLQKSEESVPVEDGENADSEDLGEGTSTTENQSSQTSTSIDKNSINQNEKANESDSVQTGDFTSIIPVSIVLVVSAAIIIFLLHKKRNRIFLFFLGIVGSALLFNNGVIDSKAAETVNQRNISVNEIIQVGDNKYELQVNVNYEWVNNQDDEDSEIIQLTIDQSDFTTEEKEVTLSGSYTGNVAEITYENVPGDESYGAISGGKISFADNKWSLELNTLETGENNITISAVNNEGENATVSIQIILNGLYEYSQADIVTDESTGATYVDNILLVFFESGLSINEQMDIIDSVSGKIVGSENMINQLQVRIPNTDYTGMKEAIDILENIDGVICATVDAAGYVDMQTNGEEPEFTYPADGETDYQNLAWWYDDIGANYLPIYDEASIDIGIVDTGFDFSHEDLQLTNVSNDSFIDDHGTHVAGIIGAKKNDIGINGIAPNHNIYCYNFYTNEDQSGLTEDERNMITNSKVLDGVLKTINAGAKVVNLSFTYGAVANSEEKTIHGKEWSAYIYALIDAGHDFLLVECAGNSGIDTTGNAYLAMINEDNCVTSLDISASDILGKAVIVGSAEQNESGGYQLSSFSNGGDRVDISAPGRCIFSTITNGYDYSTGTSMAAPMVTGAIAGIWEIDPSMTGKEVRDLVLNSASNIVSSNPDTPNASDSNRTSYPLLNIQAAVEMLYGSVTGQVVSEDQIPLDYVSVELFNSDNKKVTSGYTDENGNFSFSLPEGTFTIKFIKSGYETREMSVDVSYQTITALLEPVVMNVKSVGIQGNVIDEAGTALTNVNVEIRDSNSDEEVVSLSTDENGEFFASLENGEYKVSFRKDGYDSVIRDNVIVFDGIFVMDDIIMSASSSGSNNNFMTDISAPDENATYIYTISDLLNATSGNYVLANDLDLSEYNNGVWVPLTITGNLTLDGQGHIIRNLYVPENSESYYAGLYGSSNNYSCTFKNLGMENVNIVASDAVYSGGIIGYITNGVTLPDNTDVSEYAINIIVDNCYITGSVTATTSAGGLIGYVYNRTDYSSLPFTSGVQLSNISVNATINSEENSGGLIGRLYGRSFSNGADYGGLNLSVGNCRSEGVVTATLDSNDDFFYSSNAGGIIGEYDTYNVNSSVNINDTSSYCSISGQCSGGIIGEMSFGRNVSLNNCYTNCQIAGYETAGGLLGTAGGGSDGTTTTVTNCSTEGIITAPYCLGGLMGIGSLHTTIDNCVVNSNIQSETGYYTMHMGGVIGSTGLSFTTTINNTIMSGNLNINATSTTGTLSLGGILGYNDSSDLQIGNCSFSGSCTVTCAGTGQIGGIIGDAGYSCVINSICTFANFEQGIGVNGENVVNSDLIIAN